MSISLVLAAALALSGQDGPVMTAPTLPTETAESIRRREAMAYAYPLPTNAPTEDYAFLGYCAGLINGHVMLGETLGTSADAELLRLGRLERQDFQSALARGAPNHSAAERQASQSAYETAMGRWAPYLAETNADRRQEAFDLFFGLPGRCEHAARRVRDNITTAPATLAEVGLSREEVLPPSIIEAEQRAAEEAAAAAAAAAAEAAIEALEAEEAAAGDQAPD